MTTPQHKDDGQLDESSTKKYIHDLVLSEIQAANSNKHSYDVAAFRISREASRLIATAVQEARIDENTKTLNTIKLVRKDTDGVSWDGLIEAFSLRIRELQANKDVK